MTEISPWVTYSWWYLCQVSLFMVYNISVYGIWASMTYRCCSQWWWCLKFQKLGSVTLPPPETRSSDYTYVCPLNVAFECFNFSSLWVIFQCRSRLYGRTDQLLTQFFFSSPRSEGWPHHGHTFSIYLCPLSFWLTLPRRVLSTSWCCPPGPCVAFLACVHLALFLALSFSPGNSLVSSWRDHSMLASLLWQCL